MFYRNRKRRWRFRLSSFENDRGTHFSRMLAEGEFLALGPDEAKQIGLEMIRSAWMSTSPGQSDRFHASIEPQGRFFWGIDVSYPADAWRIKPDLSTGGKISTVTDACEAFELIYAARITEHDVRPTMTAAEVVANPPKFPDLK